MRAGIVAIFCFAGLLALGHYVAAPFFCRGELAIPTLDPRALCGADMHFSRSGSVLLYFASIAGALFFGIVLGLLPGRNKKPIEEKKPETNAVATFEQIVAEEEKKQQGTVVANPSAAQTAVTATTPPAEVQSAATPETPATAPAEVPGPAHATAAAAQAAIKSAISNPIPPKPSPAPVQIASPSPETTAKAEAITVGLAAKKSAQGSFDGTNQELIERFRELRKQENVNSIAQAQRLLDESTLSALGKGIDPKQHLSDVAHLVLTEDPDLKSGVVRGVVVHIAARLKELGVVQKIPSPAKPAA